MHSTFRGSPPPQCCPSPSTKPQPDASARVETQEGTALPRVRKSKKLQLHHIYKELSKARLSALVVGSAAGGFLLAGAPLSLSTGASVAALSVGTFLCSASANTFNQVYETKTDGRMARTRTRPLPSGRISVEHAAGFGVASGVAGTALLCVVNSPLVAALGAANILLYAGVYTPLKQVSTLNTTVGAVVGAIPPLMGWGAAAALMNPGLAAAGAPWLGAACLGLPDPWLLAGVLFAWQYPHFLSLSYLHRRDYASGSHVMHTVVDPSGGVASRLAVAGGAVLTALPLASVALGAATPWLAVETLVLNGYAMRQMAVFMKDVNEKNARAVFRTSLWYLPVLMALMVAHSTHQNREDSPVNQVPAQSKAAPVVVVAAAKAAESST